MNWHIGRPLWYLLDDQGNPYPSTDHNAVEQLLGNIEKRRVSVTEKEIAGHHIMVSTVFLVMDHDHFIGKPILYETMVFIDDESVGSATRRYHTKEEAKEGHAEVEADVERVLMELGQANLDTAHIIGLLTN